MWLYEQRTGKLLNDHGDVEGIGYAGRDDGLNQPTMQSVHSVGPIPQGMYTIGPPYNSSHSPYTLRLTPYPENEMFGRDGFLIHGDLVSKPGQHLASEGCIILARGVREAIWESGDHSLRVVSGDVNL